MASLEIQQNHIAQLSRVNLNLLPHLDMLLVTASVSKAARLMCVAQSTMSKALSQLRDFFNDPLLVRRGNHSILTDKAIALQRPVRQLMESVVTLLDNHNETPATSTRTFNIALGPMAMDLVMPRLVSALHAQAPNIKLHCQMACGEVQDSLVKGEFSLTVCTMQEASEPMLNYHSYSNSFGFGLLMDVDHPLAQKEQITPDDLSAYSYVQVMGGFSNCQAVKNFLDELNLKPEIRYSFPNLGAMTSALEGSQLLTLIPSNLKYQTKGTSLTMKTLPNQAPDLNFCMAWPDHWEYNRIHRWFRELIDRIVCEVAKPYLDLTPLP
ncbi:LysR family transcriptional regulator [Sansalvadorimonas verongulae]|uniref:LysR family transcriptional regulator n=1 Tax=Sansalvadorimonas verongulae TaxID=2172824 RepID=UPI0018AD1B7C|nr:LysR family transcriptional regulator [Sansalvadorimonas verongulae]